MKKTEIVICSFLFSQGTWIPVEHVGDLLVPDLERIKLTVFKDDQKLARRVCKKKRCS